MSTSFVLPRPAKIAIIFLLPGVITGIFMLSIPGQIGAGGKYESSFMPTVWGFALGWTSIYVMEGLALSMLYVTRGFNNETSIIALIIFGMQFFINLMYIPISKQLESIYWNATLVFLLQFLVPANMISFYRIRPLCGALYILYSFWSVLSTALAIDFLRLNT